MHATAKCYDLRRRDKDTSFCEVEDSRPRTGLQLKRYVNLRNGPRLSPPGQALQAPINLANRTAHDPRKAASLPTLKNRTLGSGYILLLATSLIMEYLLELSTIDSPRREAPLVRAHPG